MSWLAHVRNLADVAPVPHGLAWRPAAALVATAGVFFVWSAFDGQLPAESTSHATTFVRSSREAPPPEKVSIPVKPMNYTAGRGTTTAEPVEEQHPNAAPELLPRERHERPDYVVEPPDVLTIAVRSDEAGQETLAPLNGQRLVEPDGSITLSDDLDSVEVGGLTLAEIPNRIHEQLERNGLDVDVTVSVAAQNSKVYYIITDAEDDQCGTVIRNPASGRETVRDALDQLPDVDWTQKNVWIARPVAGDQEHTDKIIPVHAVDIVEGADTATNIPLEPGDRVFIVEQSDVWQRLNEILSTTWGTLVEMFW